MAELSVPDVAGLDAMAAALAYARAGWYVGPIAQGSKHPGSILRDGWDEQTSREPADVAAWFAGRDSGVFLHVGRSGAVAFDVDRPDALPPVLADAITDGCPPWASTRTDAGGRGHYLFATPPGRRFGNGGGALGGAWGEVRGENGVIVVAPTRHRHAATGGRYAWQRTGVLPWLPDSVADALPDSAGDAAAQATPAEVQAFLTAHTPPAATPGQVKASQGPATKFRTEVAAGAGRHDTAVSVLTWGLSEARAGVSSAQHVYESCREAFLADVTRSQPGRVLRTPADAAAEFDGIAAWAVAQASAGPLRESRRATPEGQLRGLVAPVEPGSRLPAPRVSSDAPRVVVAPEEPQGDTGDAPDGGGLDDEAFWTARPVLAAIREAARARRVGPYAVLGAAAARVVGFTLPALTLPPLVGGPASLNLFVAIVGASGSGKGAAERVAAELLPATAGLVVRQPGSGEGIAHAYMPPATGRGGQPQQEHPCVMFSVPEIDRLAAQADRKGTTLLPILRAAWSGEDIGSVTADRQRRLTLPPHSYRATLVAGVQPARAGVLLDDADGGTPQRFLWLPTVDPAAPDVAPEWPGALAWRALPVHARAMRVPDVVRAEVDAQRLARVRGHGDPLDSHATLARLKAAAALAILDGRHDVSVDDWALSAVVMAVSDATRAEVQQARREADASANRARGHREAERAEIVADREAEAAIRRVCGVIVRALDRSGAPMKAGAIRRAVAGRDNAHYPEALSRLIDAGNVTSEGDLYALADRR